MQQLQAAHEEELRSVQQAAQQAQADMQAAHAAESSVIKEAHAADLNRLRLLQDALPQQLMQLQSLEPRHSSDLSPSELGACQQSPGLLLDGNMQAFVELSHRQSDVAKTSHTKPFYSGMGCC